jgi:hypothetical protein
MTYPPSHGCTNDLLNLDVDKEPSAEEGVQFKHYEGNYGQVARSMKGEHS